MISTGGAPNQQPVKLFTPAEMAEGFGVEERTFMDWRRANSWPCVRVGRTIRFTQVQVDEILARHSHTPASPVDPEPMSIAGQSKGSAARSGRIAS